VVSGIGASSIGSALAGLKFEHGGIRKAASGLIVRPSDPGTLIGEPQTGGEALIPLRGITQSAAMGLMHVAGAGYGLDVVARDRAYGRLNPGNAGGGPLRLTVDVSGASQAGGMDAVASSWFARAVHRGLVQFALDTGRSPSGLWPDDPR
jgi:hypothetical protein